VSREWLENLKLKIENFQFSISARGGRKTGICPAAIDLLRATP
jgi:hypothetical protein